MSKIKYHYIIIVVVLLFVLNSSARDIQDRSIEVFVQDCYTHTPLQSVLVAALKEGVVVDSAHTDRYGIAILHIPVTSVREPGDTPSSISLGNNYPNPFNEDTNVEIAAPEAQTMLATIYNTLGQRVAEEQITISAGYYTLNVSLAHLPTGVYFLRVGGQESSTVKLLKMGRSVHAAGPVFSVSPGSAADLMTTGKATGDEFIIRAVKDRYEELETPVSIIDEKEITIPLERNNIVEFVVVDKDGYEVKKKLEIKKCDYRTVITTPYTLTLKSGVYTVTGDVDAGVSLEKEVEIPSVDTTIVLSIEKEEDDADTVTDIDGNVYKILAIGDNLWMKENLRTTRYSNGDVIPQVTEDSKWQTLDGGAWAYYENDPANDASYGKLYNWFAVDDSRGLCPGGWHVPDDDEWKQLEMYLGMSEQASDDEGSRGTDEGGKLKSTRTTPAAHPRWDAPNTGATNESGFSALPGGYRSLNGDFNAKGRHAYFWPSLPGFSKAFSWGRHLAFNESGVSRNRYDKREGFSVRCVRD